MGKGLYLALEQLGSSSSSLRNVHQVAHLLRRLVGSARTSAARLHIHGCVLQYSLQYHISDYLFIQVIMSNPMMLSIQRLSAGIATSRGVLVLVVNLVGTVAGHASRGHSLLLHGLDGGVGGVVLGADLVVEGSVGGGLVEGGDLGDVLAVGLAGVLDGLIWE
jgi:hypothetical protein